MLARLGSHALFFALWYAWAIRDAAEVWSPTCVRMVEYVDHDGVLEEAKRAVYYCSLLRGAMPLVAALLVAAFSPLIILEYKPPDPPRESDLNLTLWWYAKHGTLGFVLGLLAVNVIDSTTEFLLLSLPGFVSFPFAAGFALVNCGGHLGTIFSLFLMLVFITMNGGRFFGLLPLGLALGLFWASFASWGEGVDRFAKEGSLVVSVSAGALWAVHEHTKNSVRGWLRNLISFYTFHWVWPTLKNTGIQYEDLPKLDEDDEPGTLCEAFLEQEHSVETPFQLLRLCCYTIQKKTFLTSMLHGWLYLTCMTIDPLLMHELLSSDRSNIEMDIALGLGLSLSMLVRVSCMEICFFYSVRTMAAARSALVVAIFRKAVGGSHPRAKVDNENDDDVEQADLPTLMSSDADKIGAFAWVVFFLASWTFAILSLPIYLAILSKIVGFGASCVGIAVLLFGGSLTRKIATCAQPLFMKLQGARDVRSSILRSALSSMLSVKMFADEARWTASLNDAREKEMAIWMRVRYVSAMNGLFSSMVTMSVPVVVFAWITQVDKETLSPAAAFTTLLIINQISWSVGTLPDIFNLWSALSPSAARLLKFFKDHRSTHEFTDQDLGTAVPNDDGNVCEIEKGTVIGFDKPLFKFEDDVAIPKGELILLTGGIGAGKSCLVEVLSGASPCISGSIRLSSRRCLVEQKPFLMNGTVVDNVVFGKVGRLDREKLNRAFRDASLDKDLLALTNHELTLVGDGGVQLSGGQRVRVALARALYCRDEADLFVFDDLLASMDGETSQAVWRSAILPLVNQHGKTVILSSSFPSAELLAACDIRIHIEDEQPLSVVRNTNKILPVDWLASATSTSGAAELSNSPSLSPREGSIEPEADQHQEESYAYLSIVEVERAVEKSLQSKLGKVINGRIITEVTDELVGRRDDDDRDESDQAEAGSTISFLDLSEYWSRFGAMRLGPNFPSKTLLFIFILGCSILEILSPFWLAHWTETEKDGLMEYVGIQILQLTMAQIGFIFLTFCALGASMRIHSAALKRLFASPMSFFDANPAGRLLNVLLGDLRAIDESLPDNGYQQIKRSLVALMQIIVIALYAKLVVFIVPLLFFVYRFILRKVRAPSRDARRIEAASNAPVYIGFLDALRGQRTIRAFGRQSEFIALHSARAKQMATAKVGNEAIGKWAQALAVQTGCLLYLSCALAGIGALYETNGKTFSVAKLALLLTFAGILQRTGMDLMMGWTAFEASLVSVERISSLLRLMPEQDTSPLIDSTTSLSTGRVLSESQPSPFVTFSSRAAIPPMPLSVEFRNVRLRYRLYRPLVLKDASFFLPGGCKAAIVGRSGCGKSSIFLALLRIYPISSGAILLGRRNIDSIHLRELRRSGDIRVVLQDAILPHPTLRGNLGEDISDFEARSLLRRVGLVSKRFQSDLDFEVGPGGSLLSVGERQLVCLARALHGQPKLLLCDECTSSVDERTDDLIHRDILNLKDVTVLSVLHRTTHLAKFQYVVVVDAGRVVRVEKNF